MCFKHVHGTFSSHSPLEENVHDTFHTHYMSAKCVMHVLLSHEMWKKCAMHVLSHIMWENTCMAHFLHISGEKNTCMALFSHIKCDENVSCMCPSHIKVMKMCHACAFHTYNGSKNTCSTFSPYKEESKRDVRMKCIIHKKIIKQYSACGWQWSNQGTKSKEIKFMFWNTK